MSDIKLSIILPAYNAERTVKKAIDSVLSNSSRNFQLIVIDDGSTDETNKIIKGCNDSRLILLETKNSGVSSARNTGISRAEGEYITFIDSDDYYVDGAVDKLIGYIEKYEFDMLGFGYYSQRIENGEIIKTSAGVVSENLSFTVSDATKYFRYIFESSHILLQTSWNKVFRRDIIAENNICFDTKMVCYENLTVIWEYLKHAEKIVFISDILYNYCSFAGKQDNVIEKRRKLELTEDVSACYGKFNELCEKFGYPKQFRDYMNVAFSEDYIFCSRKYFGKSDKYSKKEQINAFYGFLNDEKFKILRNEYLSGMGFYRILFTLSDRGFKKTAYGLYRYKIIK